MEKSNLAYSTPSLHHSTTSLHISSLSLHHFRNYISAHLELSPAPVVLTGKNGAGKTNILEALSLLTPGRGLRRAKISEMDNQQYADMAWVISAHVQGIQGEAQIGTGRDTETNPLPNPSPLRG